MINAHIISPFHVIHEKLMLEADFVHWWITSFSVFSLRYRTLRVWPFRISRNIIMLLAGIFLHYNDSSPRHFACQNRSYPVDSIYEHLSLTTITTGNYVQWATWEITQITQGHCHIVTLSLLISCASGGKRTQHHTIHTHTAPHLYGSVVLLSLFGIFKLADYIHIDWASLEELPFNSTAIIENPTVARIYTNIYTYIGDNVL